MKIGLFLLSMLFISACSTEEQTDIYYDVQLIDYSQVMTPAVQENVLDVSIEGNNSIIHQNDFSDALISFHITNRSNQQLEVGRGFELEQFDENRWKRVTPSEDLAYTTEIVFLPPDDVITHTIRIDEWFEDDTETVGGTFRLNNEEQFYIYFVVNRFAK